MPPTLRSDGPGVLAWIAPWWSALNSTTVMGTIPVICICYHPQGPDRQSPMAHFPTNDIMTLVGPSPRFDLAESFGPDLHLRDVLGPDDFRLGYGSAEGDPGLRAMIAERHGVGPD